MNLQHYLKITHMVMTAQLATIIPTGSDIYTAIIRCPVASLALVSETDSNIILYLSLVMSIDLVNEITIFIVPCLVAILLVKQRRNV